GLSDINYRTVSFSISPKISPAHAKNRQLRAHIRSKLRHRRLLFLFFRSIENVRQVNGIHSNQIILKRNMYARIMKLKKDFKHYNNQVWQEYAIDAMNDLEKIAQNNQVFLLVFTVLITYIYKIDIWKFPPTLETENYNSIHSSKHTIRGRNPDLVIDNLSFAESKSDSVPKDQIQIG
ncbi:hypothetical protein PanWU01x14_189410, partial [Parasponia andersonii]